MKGRKVPIKYRDRSGNTWAGRGAQPAWLREQLKAGAKLEDFAVEKTARQVSPRKYKKRRRKRSDEGLKLAAAHQLRSVRCQLNRFYN
jgi:hypothetical protein